MSSPNKPHVLIIGAGIGGLTLGQALRKKNISFEIFERDALKGRSQGWAIGIHSVLKELVASIPADVPPIITVDHLRPLDLPAQMIYHDNEGIRPRVGVEDPGDKSIIRANRERLHNWLAINMPVQYNKTAKSISEDPSAGTVTVHFTDGTSATGTMLVGADGVHSIVREYLLAKTGTPDPLTIVPIKIIIGEVTLSGTDFENELSLGYSTYRVFRDIDDENGPSGWIFSGLSSVSPDGKSGNYYWAVSSPNPDADIPTANTKGLSPEKLLETAKKVASGFKPQFRRIIELTKPEGMMWPPLTIRSLELEKDNLPVGQITLLGDAAHCMAPFRGEGAVNAMKDALNLATAIDEIINSDGDDMKVKELMGAYQEEMLERGVAAARASKGAIRSSNEGRVTWGQPVKEIAAKTISLADIPLLP